LKLEHEKLDRLTKGKFKRSNSRTNTTMNLTKNSFIKKQAKNFVPFVEKYVNI